MSRTPLQKQVTAFVREMMDEADLRAIEVHVLSATDGYYYNGGES